MIRHHRLRPGARPSPPQGHSAPSAAFQRIEELGQTAASHGAPVFFQPTVAHRHAAIPAMFLCLVAAACAVVGLWSPLPGMAGLLGVTLSAVRDVDGGESWLRRLLPKHAGWTAEIELQSAPADTPTLILWAPIPGRAYGRLAAGRLSRALIAIPTGLGALACLGVALAPELAPALGRNLTLLSAGGLVLCAMVSAVVLRPSRQLHPEADPASWVLPLAHRLARHPIPAIRLLVLVGTEGAVWGDDLMVTLRNRAHRYPSLHSILLAVEPGPGPLSVVDQEGLIIARPAPSLLVDALKQIGLPTTPGRTGAVRAWQVGLPAIGLQGMEATPGLGPEHVEKALRCLATLLTSDAA